MREVVYINENKSNITKGKKYELLGEKIKGFEDYILIRNDSGKKKWYAKMNYCIISFGELSEEYVRYIGESNNSLTNGNIYQLFDRPDIEYYYLMSDRNEYVGWKKINYFGGGKTFENISKISILREEKLNKIGI